MRIIHNCSTKSRVGDLSQLLTDSVKQKACWEVLSVAQFGAKCVATDTGTHEARHTIQVIKLLYALFLYSVVLISSNFFGGYFTIFVFFHIHILF
jgi:hypothetical protein